MTAGSQEQIGKVHNSSASEHSLILFGGVLLVGLLVRLLFIEARPLHSDEGVNFYFLGRSASLGYYPYSHENYHGPLYFYLLWLITAIGKPSVLMLRLPSAVASVVAVAPLWWIRSWLSKGQLLFMAIFALFSSSLVFVGRYAIHEALFCAGTSVLACAALRWRLSGGNRWLWWCGLGLGILVATKETFIISLFCIWWAFWSTGAWRRQCLKLWQSRDALCLGLGLAAVIVVLSYTGGLQWMGGLRELALSVPQWIDRGEGDTGHFKPFLTYLWMMVGEGAQGPTRLSSSFETQISPYAIGAEWHLAALVFLVPAYFVQARRTEEREGSAVPLFLLIWTLTSFLVYSWVSYKTPWLIVNISFPAALLLGFCLDWREARITTTTQLVKAALATGLISIACMLTWLFTFAVPFGKGNPHSYVHTSQGMMDFLKDIEHYGNRSGLWTTDGEDDLDTATGVVARPNASTSKRPKPIGVLIAVNQYWPIPYYLRNPDKYAPAYMKQKGLAFTRSYADRYQVLVLPKGSTGVPSNFVKRYYRLSDVQEADIYYRRSIR